jgi:protein-tyrosine phosphatase
MINVLFVCLGNICRSPMAEAVFQHLVEDAGLDGHIMVDSAGTAGYHVGEPAHRGTLKTLTQHDIVFDGRARQLMVDDLHTFDYVLAMDASNLSDIHALPVDDNAATVALFLQYAYDAGTVDTLDVPDPYYDGRFDWVYQLVYAGSLALLDHIRAEHHL